VSLSSEQQPHHAREIAESFGVDADRYDRARPRYPDEMVNRILAESPGRDVLDVGCGTGIVARQFQAAGCDVLGVDVDPRMVEFARRTGLDAELGTFENWDPAGRAFDAIVAGQSWHWVDPVAGAAKAAEALRPDGRLAVFWNVAQPPPELADGLSSAYRRVLPDSPFSNGVFPGLGGYTAYFASAADGLQNVGSFGDAEQWRFDWQHSYGRQEWLERVPTFSGHDQFTPEKLNELLSCIGAAIDAVGGSFTMSYTAAVLTAQRRDAA
jgi:SAM-dependent methyltransferase